MRQYWSGRVSDRRDAAVPSGMKAEVTARRGDVACEAGLVGDGTRP